MKNENDFVGVDLHTNRLTAFYIRGSERWSEDFELSELPKFLETLRSETYVAVEASCNTFMFNDLVRRVTPNVSVVNPYKMKLISMVNKKTDKVDAEKLAMFLKSQVLGGEEMIEPVYVPEQEIRDLRSLFATHKNILGQIVMTKNRIHALLKQHMLLVKASDITSKAGRARIKILTSFPGISAFTACALIADIGDIKRFPNAKKLASYLRSAPGVDSSNETTKIKKTNKFGRRLSIELLIQGVTHFKTAHPGLAAWHGMMMDRKKSKGKVRIAICRKVICQIFQMLRKGEYHHHRNEVLHLEKMRLYDRAVAKLATA